MSEAARTVEVMSWEDLILMVIQMPAPIVHCVKKAGRFVYFTFFQLLPRTLAVYYLVTDKKVPQRFIAYDRIKNAIEFTDQLSTQPHLVHVPIIDIKKEDVLPKAL